MARPCSCHCVTFRSIPTHASPRHANPCHGISFYSGSFRFMPFIACHFHLISFHPSSFPFRSFRFLFHVGVAVFGFKLPAGHQAPMSDGEVARAFAQHAELSSRGDIALRRPALLNALLQVLAAIHPHADEREWQAIRAKFIGDFDKNIARTQTDCHSASDFRLGVFLAGGRVMAAAAWEALQRTLVLQLRARRQAERNSEQVQLPSGAASSSGVAAHSEPRGKLLIQRLQNASIARQYKCCIGGRLRRPCKRVFGMLVKLMCSMWPVQHSRAKRRGISIGAQTAFGTRALCVEVLHPLPISSHSSP